jgi:ParB family chromosome partitioning protein
VKNLVRERKITFGHARTLVGSENALQIAEHIVNHSLSVRQTEELMREQKKDVPLSTSSNDVDDVNDAAVAQLRNSIRRNQFIDPDVVNVANQISSLVGMPVTIKLKNRGGTVQIEFKNFDELDMFVQKLNK